MATKEELQKELTEWEVPFSEEDNYATIEGKHRDAKKVRDGQAGNNTGGSPPANPPSNQGKNVFYYLLKVRHYVNDTERWDAGLYRTSKRIKRLDSSPVSNVESFEGEIPEFRVYEIAKSYMVKITDSKGKMLPAEEVLEELVTVK